MTKDEKREYDKQRYIAKREQLLRQSSEYQKRNLDKGAQKQARYRAKQGKIKIKDNYLKRTYGISWDEYLQIYNDQTGACKICRKPLEAINEGRWNQTANVDHCHLTGKIRGLLCNPCNQGIGSFKDSAALLRLAAEYLDACD